MNLIVAVVHGADGKPAESAEQIRPARHVIPDSTPREALAQHDLSGMREEPAERAFVAHPLSP